MISKLLKNSTVRPLPSLRRTDWNYLHVLQEGGFFIREVFPNSKQRLRVSYNGDSKVLMSAVFYDMLERGLIQVDHTEQAEKSLLEYFTFSPKGTQIIEGKDPNAPPDYEESTQQQEPQAPFESSPQPNPLP